MDTKWKDKNKVNNFILAHIPQAYMQIYALHCSSRVCVYVHLDIHVFLIYFWTEWLTNKWMYTECNEEEIESVCVCAQKVKKTRILTIFIKFNSIILWMIIRFVVNIIVQIYRLRWLWMVIIANTYRWIQMNVKLSPIEGIVYVFHSLCVRCVYNMRLYYISNVLPSPTTTVKDIPSQVFKSSNTRQSILCTVDCCHPRNNFICFTLTFEWTELNSMPIKFLLRLDTIVCATSDSSSGLYHDALAYSVSNSI